MFAVNLDEFLPIPSDGSMLVRALLEVASLELFSLDRIPCSTRLSMPWSYCWSQHSLMQSNKPTGRAMALLFSSRQMELEMQE